MRAHLRPLVPNVLLAAARCPLAMTAVVGALAACSTPVNPSFPITQQEAYRALEEMRESPQPLERPVVVLGGFLDPGFATGTMARVLESVVTGGPIITVTFATSATFDECRGRLLEAVLAAMPETLEVGPGRFETVEVDVVANSMGGLVARHAAMWPDMPAAGSEERNDELEIPHADTRLRIVRLMTISTPHRGAVLAKPGGGSALERSMALQSPFLQYLDAALPDADYELICYARLGDAIVGIENTAPPGEVAYWVTTPPFEAAHALASHDRRLLADIARRLRGEAPFATPPPSPLPE